MEKVTLIERPNGARYVIPYGGRYVMRLVGGEFMTTAVTQSMVMYWICTQQATVSIVDMELNIQEVE